MAQKTLDFDNPLMKKKTGRPRKPGVLHTDEGAPTVQNGLPADLRRFTVILKTENCETLKNYAYTQRIPIKDALNEILEDFFTRYRKNPNNEPILDRNERTRRNGKD